MKHSSKLYRSKFEEEIAKSLKKRKIKFKYEEKTYPLTKQVRGICGACGSNAVYRNSGYTPDWFIYRTKHLQFIVETKGKLDAKAKQTLLAFKEQYLEIDLRIVFMRNNKLTKVSKNHYSDWAEKHGFEWAIGDIPDEWL